jgi:hypothetical protein
VQAQSLRAPLEKIINPKEPKLKTNFESHDNIKITWTTIIKMVVGEIIKQDLGLQKHGTSYP